jgi:glutamate N-acetyltransferase / amino-acid N-acetyltransferase
MHQKIENGSITTPVGFIAGGIAAGIKSRGGLDLGVIYSGQKCVACGMFTRNKVKAYPVAFSEHNLSGGSARVIVANAGCANACTGEVGKGNVHKMAHLAAAKFGVADNEAIVASTGVIGVQLPIEKIANGIAALKATPEGGHDFARAIMTTDTLPKEIALSVDGGKYTIAGVAKGSGMIHPDMATMFCFITTDAEVELEFLRKALKKSVDRSFNMISVDGDTSTSDIVAILANGKAGNAPINSRNGKSFQDALDEICIYLAKFIARDGEGATRLIEVIAENAASSREAKTAARTVASSYLLKSAIHGNDPNWGRIAAAVGRSGVKAEQDLMEISINNAGVFKNGMPTDFDAEALSAAMKESDAVTIRICLNQGRFKATAWGCDLSEEYVTINSDYTT